MGYSFRLAARVVLYASSHRLDSTYHGLCYTSRRALAGTHIAQLFHPMKDRSDDPSHHEWMLFPQSNKESFISTIPQTGQHIPLPSFNQLRSTGWNKTSFNGPTTRDRSENTPHHEQSVYHGVTHLAPCNKPKSIQKHITPLEDPLPSSHTPHSLQRIKVKWLSPWHRVWIHSVANPATASMMAPLSLPCTSTRNL